MKKKYVFYSTNQISPFSPIIRRVAFFIILLSVIIFRGSIAQNNLSTINSDVAGSSCSKDQSNNVDQFINKFIKDAEFQRIHTQSMIFKSTLDITAEPEPRVVKNKIRINNISFPVMPSEFEMKSQNINLKVYKQNNSAKLVLYKPDTGYLVNYFFEFKECWLLVEIDDKST